MSLIFVDVEAYGPCPSMGCMTEFGAVCYDNFESFHGVLCESKWPEDGKMPVPIAPPDFVHVQQVFTDFEQWLKLNSNGSPVFVSDNPAYDWQWINDGFHRTLFRNPFGYSARRIGDFYAGLCGDFWKSNQWKRLRRTRHDHNPVHDSLGNVEAFQALLKGER